MARRKIETEWVQDSNGLIVKKRGKRITYPDPLCEDDFLEAHFGGINMMRRSGGSEEEIERANQEFAAIVWGPPEPIVPMPKTLSAEDAVRARGMGIRLD